MGKLAILLMNGPYTTQRADTVINIVEAALDEGHEITGVYLYVDGVYAANKKIDPKFEEEKNIPQLFKKITEKGIPVRACPVCGNYRGLTEEDQLVEGVEFDGLGGFAEMLEEADKVIAFTD